MFEQVATAPPDPILGLSEAFVADQNPEKINLSVGVYKNAGGQTPVLKTVAAAEQQVLDAQQSKAYKPITGDPVYGARVRELLFGAGHELVDGGGASTAHTPGGTGALRVAGDYLHRIHPSASIWLSDPTWANHPAVFGAANLQIKTYPYFDVQSNAVDIDAMLKGFDGVEAGDAVLVHACCHNPTGADPTAEQWDQIGQALAQRGALPVVDFAYQGFADGIEADAAGLRALLRHTPEMLICSSFSKNFGLYNERTGAMTVVGGSADATAAVTSQVKLTIRTNYSNPPAHGAAIVTQILGDAEQRSAWEQEVAQMRDRINAMRTLFVDTLKAKGANRDFSFITKQRGMFSFSGLSRDQVAALRDNDSIYIVGSGRINVAGMTEANMDRLCEAIVKVLA